MRDISRGEFFRIALGGVAGLAAGGLFDKPPSPEQALEGQKPPESTPEELARQEQEAQERALKEREEALSPERIMEAINAYREAFPQRGKQLMEMDDRDIVKLLARVMYSEDHDYLAVSGLIGVTALNRWANINRVEQKNNFMRVKARHRSFERVVMGKAKEFGPQDKIRRDFSTELNPENNENYLLFADMLLQTGAFSQLYKDGVQDIQESVTKEMSALEEKLRQGVFKTKRKRDDVEKRIISLRERLEQMQNGILFPLAEDEMGPERAYEEHKFMRDKAEKWWDFSKRFQFLQTMFLHPKVQQEYYDDYEAKKAAGNAVGATVYRSPKTVMEDWEVKLGVHWIDIPLGRAGIKGFEDPNDYVRFGAIVGPLDPQGLSEDEFSAYMRKDALLAACYAPSSAKRAAA
ncbi:MAG: hypothetical protein WC659_05375 [Patescibacteria group bacterium]